MAALVMCGLVASNAEATERLPAAPTAEAREYTTISGLAFEFLSRELLEGATISLDEYPWVRDVTAVDGTFVLENVPVGVEVTPRIELRGYKTMWHGTFTTTEAPVENLFFQTVPTYLYHILAASIDVRLNPARCQLVTTVTFPEMNELDSWEDYQVLTPHGLPGMEALLDPTPSAEHGPVYFNDDVFPDPTLTATSTDGGVLWVNLRPEGSPYIVTAEDPQDLYTFSEVKILCKAGRLINASPPYAVRSYPVE